MDDLLQIPGCPIGNPGSGHLHLPAAYQLITSFIASESQGIRHVPLLFFVLPITYGRYILSAFNFTFWSHHVKERCFKL